MSVEDVQFIEPLEATRPLPVTKVLGATQLSPTSWFLFEISNFRERCPTKVIFAAEAAIVATIEEHLSSQMFDLEHQQLFQLQRQLFHLDQQHTVRYKNETIDIKFLTRFISQPEQWLTIA